MDPGVPKFYQGSASCTARLPHSLSPALGLRRLRRLRHLQGIKPLLSNKYRKLCIILPCQVTYLLWAPLFALLGQFPNQPFVQAGLRIDSLLRQCEDGPGGLPRFLYGGSKCIANREVRPRLPDCVLTWKLVLPVSRTIARSPVPSRR